MMMKSRRGFANQLLLVLTVLISSSWTPLVSAFVVPSTAAINHQSNPVLYGVVTTTTQLSQSKNNNDNNRKEPYSKVDDGAGRGVPILVIALLACVWCFTVPPEFRRAYICSDRCALEENRAAPQCNSCVTADEWRSGIAEYYANGGGIQWDFSIDPNSKMKMF
ncbi:expressed unknown protein [Seminavis robusta]|uniref:Uncharacterized protein n=1 Tax=Seminavis robusta TaxID=568900 RepID=A0A9N8H7Q2_9STRA|nr:expressed unknown protein [Seminavis robusta]|eukprot:Sro73_g040210.1 n/a (164) ;mRNA; f:10390-10881